MALSACACRAVAARDAASARGVALDNDGAASVASASTILNLLASACRAVAAHGAVSARDVASDNDGAA